MTPPRTASYAAATGPELLLARGPPNGAQLLLVQPLFEEATFTRTFANTVLRALATTGIGGWLFDLPGQGDSLVPLESLRLVDWIAATRVAAARIAAETGRAPHLATIRGGALLTDAAIWRLAPCDGAGVLRPLRRAAALGDSAGLAGWPIGARLEADLAAAPCPDGPTIAWPAGAPPWRRAEPANDPAAAVTLAADLARRIACAAR